MSLANLMPMPVDVDEVTIMPKLGLTFTQASILLWIWLGRGSKDFSGYRSTRQHIYNMRGPLAVKNIHIVNYGEGRYGLPKPSRDILNQMFS